MLERRRREISRGVRGYAPPGKFKKVKLGNGISCDLSMEFLPLDPTDLPYSIKKKHVNGDII